MELIEILLEVVSDPDDLNTPGTPQNSAMEWLINLDPAYTCPHDPLLVQRYVMAVFYYSTEGADWARCSAPEDFDDPDSVADANQNCGSGNAWLTPDDECAWGGLRCNVDSEMERMDIGTYLLWNI